MFYGSLYNGLWFPNGSANVSTRGRFTPVGILKDYALSYLIYFNFSEYMYKKLSRVVNFIS